MELRHLERNDVVSVVLEPLVRTTEGGIVLSESEAVVVGKHFRAGRVHAAPEHYTFSRGSKTITTATPVQAGQRVLLDRFAGVTKVAKDAQGNQIHLVRMHEILGVLAEDDVIETPETPDV